MYNPEKGSSAFRLAEKKFRHYQPLTENDPYIIDFINPHANSQENNDRIRSLPSQLSTSHIISSLPKSFYSLSNIDGFYFVPNPFTWEEQKEWTKKIITEYTLENPTNISNLAKTPFWTTFSWQNITDLRWVSLGYPFKWTERKYLSDTSLKFPPDLGGISRELATVVGDHISPEAATLNFYTTKSVMGGHLDDAEHDLNRPIVSISFGCSAIFLMGGATRDVEPTPILVRSGDVVIMAGQCRKYYHGVGRILGESCPLELSSCEEKDVDDGWTPFGEFIKRTRINLNVRQVNPKLS